MYITSCKTDSSELFPWKKELRCYYVSTYMADLTIVD